ncbi:MAG: TOBE domain-containing protein, partial [Pseudomonadota bacterium]|nr:TOBE domain-containing protein [Pseudomonadota bacterium]
VRINGGTAVMPAPAARSGKVTLGIRPEDVRIDDGGDIPFHVDLVEELGAHRLLHGQLGDQTFSIHAMKDEPSPQGDTRLSLIPDNICLFDSETGKRI